MKIIVHKTKFSRKQEKFRAWYNIYNGKMIDVILHTPVLHSENFKIAILEGTPLEEWLAISGSSQSSAYLFPSEYRLATPLDFIKERIEKHYEYLR